MLKKMGVLLLAVAVFAVPALADTPVDGGVEVSDIPAPREVVEVVDERLELVESSVYTLSPITPDNTTGLTSLVLSLIGNYDPVIVEYRYQNYNSSSYSYLREVQPDYPWLVSAGIFAIVLFCSLRILGGAICKK